MPKYCPENERVKRDFAFFLQAASGKQDATIDAALRAIERFENSTGRKPFSKFHVEQARSFRAGIVDQMGRDGRPLSAATITTILKHLRNFFLWLSREPGFRSKLSANDANYFTPSDQDRRIAGARREGPVPSLKEVVQVLRAMPGNTVIEKRNRAVIAFAILTGARDGALASFRLKHINLTAGTVFQDGRFAAAGLPYVNPHAFRKTLVRLGQTLCRSPEEWKAWSQNFGHESETTTFVGYGEVPGHRQAEIIRALARPTEPKIEGLDIGALEAFLKSARASSQASSSCTADDPGR
jgi:site-specific recombinase XerC